MPVIVENKLITLNSAYSSKLNGTYNSSVLFNFKGILAEEDDIISSNICVMNAQIPVSFYTINETNNYFTVQIGSFPYIVTLLNGNYNFNTLSAMVSTAYQNAIGLSLTISINKSTGVIQFVTLNATYFNFDKSYKIFGFSPNVNYNGPTITAPYPCNLLGVKKLSIQSQKLQINSFSSVSTNLGITLATIPVDQPAFSMISYTNQTDLNKAALQTSYIDQIDLSIVDEDGNFINFNNIDWSITLVLENIRRLPDRFTTPFRELTTPVDGISGVSKNDATIDKKLKEEPLNDIKDLELLSA